MGRGQAMSPAADDHEKTAQAIEQKQPGWMVIYGYHTHQYVAFPTFPGRPPRSYVAAAYPPALITRIEQVERHIFAQSLRLPVSQPASVPPHAPPQRTLAGAFPGRASNGRRCETS